MSTVWQDAESAPSAIPNAQQREFTLSEGVFLPNQS